MASKAFLDANVLLDFFLQREDFAHAEEIMQKASQLRFAAYTTPAVLHIVSYWEQNRMVLQRQNSYSLLC